MRRIFILYFIFTALQAAGHEGMWLPQLLEQLNEPDMKALGMNISADDIYSAAHSSLKDAVVQFGGGCTAEIISDKGLLLTNHHCGNSQIQSLSSIEKNYLSNGYWAPSLADEIPCPGLTVTFVTDIRNVTDAVNQFLSDSMTEDQRVSKIKVITDSIEKAAVQGTRYKASVRSFYCGNVFYLFITDVFSDVRFVGAPPVSIGNFGGETDNWMWPRHTGDFSLFRIYAGKDNAPAAYSKENVPYTPKKYFILNAGGIKEGDFTMVLGFPGRTNSYLPACGLDLIYSQTNPDKIHIREAKLAIWQKAMNENDTIQLQYAAKIRSIANYYKKWKGEISGLKKGDVINKKKAFESQFIDWVKKDPRRQERYGQLLGDFRTAYDSIRSASKAHDYYWESLMGIELAGLVNRFVPLVDACRQSLKSVVLIREAAHRLNADLESFYRNYNSAVDEKVCAALLRLYSENVPEAYLPAELVSIRDHDRGRYEEYSSRLFRKSVFLSKEKIADLLKGFQSRDVKKITRDPAWKLISSFSQMYANGILPAYGSANKKITALQRSYMKAILEMNPGGKIFPDANSTLRVSFGQVEGMHPRDGVKYNYYTTLDGIIEKTDSTMKDFRVPGKLVDLYQRKDYGRYQSNGTVPVAFLASNHTTNGSSGSPVLNANGELIGTNFDRTLEGVMSDYYYQDEFGRSISVDIRYTLFIIEKFGNEQRLIDEMKITGQ